MPGPRASRSKPQQTVSTPTSRQPPTGIKTINGKPKDTKKSGVGGTRPSVGGPKQPAARPLLKGRDVGARVPSSSSSSIDMPSPPERSATVTMETTTRPSTELMATGQVAPIEVLMSTWYWVVCVLHGKIADRTCVDGPSNVHIL